MVKELWKAGASGSLPPTWDSAGFELHDCKYGSLHITEAHRMPENL